MGSSFISHSGLGALGAIPTSCRMRGEAQHLDGKGPGTVGQVGERVEALRIGDRDEFLIAHGGGDGGAGERQAAEFHLSVVLGGGEGKGR